MRDQGLFSSVQACTFRVPRKCWSWIGEEYGGEWIPVYVWLSPFDVHLKLSQHCLLISCIPIQNKKLGGKKEYAGGFQSPYTFIHQLFKFFWPGFYLLQLLILLQYSTVQSLSHVQLFETPWTSARQASLSINSSRSLLKLMSIQLVMPSNHLILCCPLLLLSSNFHSIRVFSKESVLRIRWPKYWSFSFSISPSNEYSGFISFRIDWLDSLSVQGTLKSLLQHHSSKASILQCSSVFTANSHIHTWPQEKP